MQKILLVEDDPSNQELVSATLKRFSVTVASTLAEARQALSAEVFDLILLDLTLPDGDGFKFCIELKTQQKSHDIPLFFLSGKVDPVDKVMGFTLGADDYITKPFHPGELRARVEAKLAKVARSDDESTNFSQGSLRFDLSRQRVYQRVDGRESVIDLTPIEFKLLFHFAYHREQVLSRDQLIDAAWGNSIHVLDRTIDTHVSNLRKKLKQSEFVIRTAHGSGYCFEKKQPTA